MEYLSNRNYRQFYAGSYYHIYNRGNNKQDIFLDDQDYTIFLDRIRKVLGMPEQHHQRLSSTNVRIKPLPDNAINILTYCLMPNHMHFLIKQNQDIGIDRFMSKLCTSYAKYFNKKYSRVGHIWQDRFKSKLITEDSYLVQLAKYINRNHPDFISYPYSGIYELLNPTNNGICDHKMLLKLCDMSEKQFIGYNIE